YGLSLPEQGIDDYKGHDVTGKIAIYVGRGPQSVTAPASFRILGARARNAIELNHAVAAIGPFGGFGRAGGGGAPAAVTPATTADARGGAPAGAASAQPQPQRGAGGGGGGRGVAVNLGDFTTVERLDKKIAPQVTANDEFFDFVFKAAGQNYADI